MSLLHNLKKVQSIKSEIRVLYRAFQDIRTPVMTKVVSALLILIYILSPIDIAPDILPLLGLSDDIIIIPLILWILIPNDIMGDARKYIADLEKREPHKHHWMFWTFIMLLVVSFLYTIYKLLQ